MRAWPGDPSVAHLIFTDHHHVPTAEELAEAIAHAARRGARAIRTSAMFPAASEVVLEHGFTSIDRLALLTIDLEPEPVSRPERLVNGRISQMRPWHHTACSQIDRAAFGLMWGNTPTSLRDIRGATPWHHARIARLDGFHGIAGFAISGAAADQGYLQRLAVDPTVQGRGLGTALVVDGLRWLRRRKVDTALVNTQVANEGAFALYRRLGFVPEIDGLAVLTRLVP